MHFWSVWHEGRDFEHYRDVRPRFCSEFGFQSYPSMPVIRSFADEADLNIASPVMESHQKNAGGNARIAETMFRYFRFPKDFANFVWLSQVQQGLAIKTAVDYWRSLKPHCMGALYWQLNDTWPVASWSSLDYGGGWKLLHYMAKRFFAPVTVSAIPTDGAFRVTAVNDTAAAGHRDRRPPRRRHGRHHPPARRSDGGSRHRRRRRSHHPPPRRPRRRRGPRPRSGPPPTAPPAATSSPPSAPRPSTSATRRSPSPPPSRGAASSPPSRRRPWPSTSPSRPTRPGRFSTNAVAVFPGFPRRDRLHPRPTATPPPSPSPPATSTRASPDP